MHTAFVAQENLDGFLSLLALSLAATSKTHVVVNGAGAVYNALVVKIILGWGIGREVFS